MKFSILVPTHNIDTKLLDICISSINSQVTKYGQPYMDFEIVLSCDKEDFSKVERIAISNTAVQIKVIIVDEPNVSKSRNACLDNAQGDWIVWCDYDDSLQPFALDTLEDYIKEKPDYNCFVYKANILGKELSYTNQMTDNYIGDRHISLQDKMIQYNLYKVPEVLWRKCISKKFLNDNMICFDNDIELYDDWYFHNVLCYYLTGVYKIDKALYNYTVNDTGLSSTSERKSQRAYILEVKKKVDERLLSSTVQNKHKIKKIKDAMIDYCREFCVGV